MNDGILFVGGPFDGQYREVPESVTEVVVGGPDVPPLAAMFFGYPSERVTYLRATSRTGEPVFVVTDQLLLEPE